MKLWMASYNLVLDYSKFNVRKISVGVSPQKRALVSTLNGIAITNTVFAPIFKLKTGHDLSRIFAFIRTPKSDEAKTGKNQEKEHY